MDVTWVPNGQSILKGMSGQLLPFDWEGKLVRMTMPNPRAGAGAGAGAGPGPGAAEVHWAQLEGFPRWASPEFGVVNPLHMYGTQPTRYMWYLASNVSTRAAQYLPTVVKLDTWTNTTISWCREFAAPVSPVFVPRDRGEDRNSDAGALLVLLIPAGDAPPPRQNAAVVLDATTLEVMSEFVLPIGPLSAAGLHNYYTGEASSV